MQITNSEETHNQVWNTLDNIDTISTCLTIIWLNIQLTFYIKRKGKNKQSFKVQSKRVCVCFCLYACDYEILQES